jgi:hypothetical protein
VGLWSDNMYVCNWDHYKVIKSTPLKRDMPNAVFVSQRVLGTPGQTYGEQKSFNGMK